MVYVFNRHRGKEIGDIIMLTFFVALLTAIVFFILGHYFGAIIMKLGHNIIGRPYLRAVFVGTTDGSMSIDAQFNNLFIYELDRQYSEMQSDIFDTKADDNEKIAIYLYDVLSGIADNYLPPEKPYMVGDIAADVQPMGYRGGETVKQVVDLSDVASKTISNNGIDIERG